ncbi:unnamed protein product [Ilex paraguariensis]|uniref:Probable purine permease n=1 Tax=Ilex paraguariensis TaxID=185542 RepID=A0ABC8T7W2_9AQUA
MEAHVGNSQVPSKEEKRSKVLKKALLLLNCGMLGLGNCAGPMVQRLYFVKGEREFGCRAGYRQPPGLFLPCAVLGILTGLDDYLAAFGVSRLPVSTSALIIATQLAFTAGFAFLLVKQKFTAFTINSVFLLSVGAVVLAFHSSTDRPAHESKAQYYMGFFMTLGASALYGFVLPMIELTYKKAKQVITYPLVMEMQMVMSFFATAFCTIGMLVNHDFVAISREAREYELGEAMYYVTLVLSAILWQFFFLGAIGVIFCASSLLSGIIIATLLPVTESLAVLFFHERFQVEKGVALTLSLWGFLSYFYGELQEIKKLKKARAAAELPQSHGPLGQN